MTAPRFHVLLAAMLSLAVLPGCASTVVSLGADVAYTASEKRTTDEVIDDNKIKIALNKLLVDESAELWKDVSTVVYRGRVLLLGSVETAGAKARAGAIGAMPEGVTEVINDIQVTDVGGPGGGPGGGIGAFLNDFAIEKSIQVKYLFAEGIDSADLRVRSVNGTVYLIGQVETWAELGRVREIARTTGDVVKVVDYLRVTVAAESCGCKKPPAPKRKPKP
jgi:osmotically-inducible protein OsmY